MIEVEEQIQYIAYKIHNTRNIMHDGTFVGLLLFISIINQHCRILIIERKEKEVIS